MCLFPPDVIFTFSLSLTLRKFLSRPSQDPCGTEVHIPGIQWILIWASVTGVDCPRRSMVPATTQNRLSDLKNECNNILWGHFA